MTGLRRAQSSGGNGGRRWCSGRAGSEESANERREKEGVLLVLMRVKGEGGGL